MLPPDDSEPDRTPTPRACAAAGNICPDNPVDVFLDVDGVINPSSLSPSPSWGWTRVAYARTHWTQVMFAPELIDRLNALADHPLVTMHWLTSWEEEAASELAPAVGLRAQAWPVLGTEDRYSGSNEDRWWKHAALVDFLAHRTGTGTRTGTAAGPDSTSATGRRVVWVDDELDNEPAAADWARAHGEAFLAVSPAPYRGLTVADMERIERFVHRTR